MKKKIAALATKLSIHPGNGSRKLAPIIVGLTTKEAKLGLIQDACVLLDISCRYRYFAEDFLGLPLYRMHMFLYIFSTKEINIQEIHPYLLELRNRQWIRYVSKIE